MNEKQMEIYEDSDQSKYAIILYRVTVDFNQPRNPFNLERVTKLIDGRIARDLNIHYNFNS